MTEYKPIEDLKPGDIVYKVEEDGCVSKLRVKDVNKDDYLIYFVDDLDDEYHAVIRIKKSYARLSGSNDYVYSTKEETIQHLEKKIKYINKQIERLEKL